MSFDLSKNPIDPVRLQSDMHAPAAGAFNCFEGRVRDHNEGKMITALEYEAYDALCRSEADKILAEALARFAILDARCVHRIGKLAVGEIAVWIGVAAAHRDASFAACRYIIDEIKLRLPIWKKEYYTNGDSGWVNCQYAHHCHEENA